MSAPLASPASRKIESLSPSSYQVISRCQMRFAFGQGATRSWAGTPATQIGDLCHGILQRMVSDRLLWDSNWRERLNSLWENDLEALVAALGHEAANWGRPEAWPDYQLKKARLKRVAARLRDLLMAEPSSTIFALEEDLHAAAGRLRGRADLVIRRPGAHRIIDFKTGRVVDRVTGLVHTGYESQLQLYAFMEHETTGEWPVEAYLFPLEGEPVAVSIDRDVAEAVGTQALAVLELYNSRAPGPQAADPNPANCLYCPFAGICPGFWTSYDDSWTSEILAVVGEAKDVFHTTGAGTNLELARTEGMAANRVLMRNIDPYAHPEIAQVAEGDVVAAVGLRQEFERSTYYLPPSAVLARR